MECCQPATWTANRSRHVASRAKDFPGRTTNSGSTLSRAVYQEGCVIRSYRCLRLTVSKSSGISSHATNPSWFVPHANQPPPPSMDAVTTTASMENHGVQPTGYKDSEPEPSCRVPCQGLPQKNDQFRLDPIQSSVPGRLCDPELSVSSSHSQ